MDVKNIITNICGILLAISGAVLASEQTGIVLDPLIKLIAVLLASVSGAVIAYFTGKLPNGKAKSIEDVINQTGK